MHKTDKHDCGGCELESAGRRAFIRQVIIGAAGLAAAPSLARASSMLVRTTKPIAERKSLRTYAVPAGDSVEIDHDSDLILVRWENAVYAFNLSCPHQNTALRWVEGSAHFQCPKHKSQYTPTGEFITGRATRGMDRLDIKRAGGGIVVDLDILYRQDEDAAGWNNAVVRLSDSGTR